MPDETLDEVWQDRLLLQLALLSTTPKINTYVQYKKACNDAAKTAMRE